MMDPKAKFSLLVLTMPVKKIRKRGGVNLTNNSTKIKVVAGKIKLPRKRKSADRIAPQVVMVDLAPVLVTPRPSLHQFTVRPSLSIFQVTKIKKNIT